MVGGVASGIAEHLGVRVTLVRLVLVLLAGITGAGVLAYAALWVALPVGDPGRGDIPTPEPGERRQGVVLVVLAGVLALLSTVEVTSTGLGALVPLAIVAVGVLLVWREFDRDSAAVRTAGEWARMTSGVTLVVVGLTVVVLGRVDAATLRSSLLAVLATIVGVGLLTVPLWLRLWRSLEGERSARIRESERTRIAAHLHDSVLQTLALIQKSSADPVQVSRLARRQERELRQWLFRADEYVPAGAGFASGGGAGRGGAGAGGAGTSWGAGPGAGTGAAATTVAGAVASVCGDVEDSYELRVDQVVVGGDRPVDEVADAVLGAVRECLVNVAKHAGVETADVYVEIGDRQIEAFVRDRGRGFDPDTVPADRQGLAGSVRHRVESRGGRVGVRSTLGRGTEIRIEMPWEAT